MVDGAARLSPKLRKAVQNFPYLTRALGLTRDAAPRLTLLWLAMVVVQGMLPAAVVWLSRPLVNGIAAALKSGGEWGAVRPVVMPALAMAGAVLAGEVLAAAGNWVRTAQSERVGEHISGLIHAKSVSMDLAFYDLPAYFDHLHRARYEAGHRPLALLESMGNLLQSGITLAAVAALLIPYGWWLPPVLLAGTLPAFFVVLQYTLRHHAWRLETTAAERRTWYFDWLLTERETAAELRLFKLGPVLQSAYRLLRKNLRRGRLRLIRQEALAALGAGACGLVVAGGAMVWMGCRAFNGNATLGDLALFYQSFSRGQGLMRSLLRDLAGIYSNSLFLGDLFAFLELKPAVSDPEAAADPPLAGRGAAIRFCDVSFRYPGSSRPALAGLNLEIPAGKVAAVVGANGAGKSTLVKLLCRFYDPDAGRVELDGADLRGLPLEAVRARVAALFQEPVHYSATVAQNIALLEKSRPEAELADAVRAAGAGAVIDPLPEGYDTLLGTWFEGGTDLSVGEWQRLALARAFFRPAPVLVLDEPTSAMDPWAEADWLKGLRAAAAGRTVVLITHRLTTAMTADVIHVMGRGRVVESGTHAELMAAGGAYAGTWGGGQRTEGGGRRTEGGGRFSEDRRRRAEDGKKRGKGAEAQRHRVKKGLRSEKLDTGEWGF